MVKHKSNNYSPDFIVHPGATLAETLDNLGMAQSELAKRISRPEKTISEIVNGNKAITPETAIQLERALNIPSSFWNNLEKNYQELKAKLEAKKTLRKEVDLAKKYPYSAMAKQDWIKPVRKLEEKVENLLSYFGVDSLTLINEVMPVTFRQHAGSMSIYSIHAWLRKGELDSRNIETRPFNKKILVSLLDTLKHYSTESLRSFGVKLEQNLAQCGIALVFTPDLPKTYVCGAARWITPQKAMIQLSLRGGYADIMWFTLYHELGHLLLHSKKEYFVDISISNGSKIEKEASDFASEQLIPNQSWSDFVSTKEMNATLINEFARKLGIHPGIIVGRLQHEKIIEYKDFNYLRAKYRFVNT